MSFTVFFLVLWFTPHTKACKDGWEPFEKSCYKRFEEESMISAHEAEALCVGKGGHLVSISSAEENDFVINAITSTIPRREYSPWIGVQVNNSAEDLGWTDGTPVGFQFWGNDSPAPDYGAVACGQLIQECAEPEWFVHYCDQRLSFRYICETTKDTPESNFPVPTTESTTSTTSVPTTTEPTTTSTTVTSTTTTPKPTEPTTTTTTTPAPTTTKPTTTSTTVTTTTPKPTTTSTTVTSTTTTPKPTEPTTTTTTTTPAPTTTKPTTTSTTVTTTTTTPKPTVPDTTTVVTTTEFTCPTNKTMRKMIAGGGNNRIWRSYHKKHPIWNQYNINKTAHKKNKLKKAGHVGYYVNAATYEQLKTCCPKLIEMKLMQSTKYPYISRLTEKMDQVNKIWEQKGDNFYCAPSSGYCGANWQLLEFQQLD